MRFAQSNKKQFSKHLQCGEALYGLKEFQLELQQQIG